MQHPDFTCSISLPNTGIFVCLPLSRTVCNAFTTVLSVRVTQTIYLANQIRCCNLNICGGIDTRVNNLKSYNCPAFLYSSMVLQEFASLVV